MVCTAPLLGVRLVGWKERCGARGCGSLPPVAMQVQPRGARALARLGKWCFAPAAVPRAERGGALGADLVLPALIKCTNSKVKCLVGGVCVSTSTGTWVRDG